MCIEQGPLFWFPQIVFVTFRIYSEDLRGSSINQALRVIGHTGQKDCGLTTYILTLDWKIVQLEVNLFII